MFDVIQLLSETPEEGKIEANALIGKFQLLSEYRKRLANLYELKKQKSKK